MSPRTIRQDDRRPTTPDVQANSRVLFGGAESWLVAFGDRADPGKLQFTPVNDDLTFGQSRWTPEDVWPSWIGWTSVASFDFGDGQSWLVLYERESGKLQFTPVNDDLTFGQSRWTPEDVWPSWIGWTSVAG